MDVDIEKWQQKNVYAYDIIIDSLKHTHTHTHKTKIKKTTTTKLLHPQATYAHPDTSPRFTPSNDKTLPVEILHITVFNHRERI